jgi:hypothetical protein
VYATFWITKAAIFAAGPELFRGSPPCDHRAKTNAPSEPMCWLISWSSSCSMREPPRRRGYQKITRLL